MNMTNSILQGDGSQNLYHRWTPKRKPEVTLKNRQTQSCKDRVTLQHETVNGVPVLRCSGRIVYGPESDCLFDAIREVLERSASLILDFKHITMIDAKGIGALLALHALA